jgi:DNA helicase II / ATP-dependent DNA helicase PcrA
MAGDQAVSAMASLNTAQREAVIMPANAILQILAGPGSGKTKVLTHRVWFLLEQGMRPENIILTTFTNVIYTLRQLVND